MDSINTITNKGDKPTYKKYEHGIKRARLRRHPHDQWAKDLSKRLHLHLSNIKGTIKTVNGSSVAVNKYPYQAYEYLKAIYAGEQEFPYIIWLSDLTSQLIAELLGIGKKDHVLTREVQILLRESDPTLYESVLKIRGRRPFDWLIS